MSDRTPRNAEEMLDRDPLLPIATRESDRPRGAVQVGPSSVAIDALAPRRSANAFARQAKERQLKIACTRMPVAGTTDRPIVAEYSLALLLGCVRQLIGERTMSRRIARHWPIRRRRN